MFSVPERIYEQAENPPQMSLAQTQTPEALSQNSPRKVRLLKKIASLQKENVPLKKEIKKNTTSDMNQFKFFVRQKCLNPELPKLSKCKPIF